MDTFLIIDEKNKCIITHNENSISARIALEEYLEKEFAEESETTEEVCITVTVYKTYTSIDMYTQDALPITCYFMKDTYKKILNGMIF